jgi:hypothetical protein
MSNSDYSPMLEKQRHTVFALQGEPFFGRAQSKVSGLGFWVSVKEISALKTPDPKLERLNRLMRRLEERSGFLRLKRMNNPV